MHIIITECRITRRDNIIYLVSLSAKRRELRIQPTLILRLDSSFSRNPCWIKISHRGTCGCKIKFTIDGDSIREDTIPLRWYYELYIMHHDVSTARSSMTRSFETRNLTCNVIINTSSNNCLSPVTVIELRFYYGLAA